jgi:membrane protein CcdC involved in cytochrome C biogenesis
MGCRFAELSQNLYELQQVLVFFHGSCLSEVTTSCCNTVLILMVAKKKLKVNNDHLYFKCSLAVSVCIISILIDFD